MIRKVAAPAGSVRASSETSIESDYYMGESGSRYFAWQNSVAATTVRMEARKFSCHVQPSDIVLDFGCGAGHILRELVCARRVGVEINPTARTAAIRQGIECYRSLAEVKDDEYNVVISNHALEHVEHPMAVLRSLRRKLAARGRMVLCLPIDDWRTQRKYDPTDVNHHLQTWTPQSLGNSLCEAGFLPQQFSIDIMTYAFPPRIDLIGSALPAPLIHQLCRLFAMVAKRRQMLVVAIK